MSHGSSCTFYLLFIHDKTCDYAAPLSLFTILWNLLAENNRSRLISKQSSVSCCMYVAKEQCRNNLFVPPHGDKVVPEATLNQYLWLLTWNLFGNSLTNLCAAATKTRIMKNLGHGKAPVLSCLQLLQSVMCAKFGETFSRISPEYSSSTMMSIYHACDIVSCTSWPHSTHLCTVFLLVSFGTKFSFIVQ